ncbi:ABC transporter ATP-binding protein [Streptomyces winkii]|uniref:ABC transporter ATP-binding protein n=1 Tax=Streptomyces winkii TaxID=3051178 RepID=UPI0028D5384D|nr:ABC transporter ATP-binding protein [Streptomyces sp. DSM 40971]
MNRTTAGEAAPGAGAPVLRVRDLTVTFHAEEGDVHAVDGVGFDVAPGEVLGVVGESGCGKSVTSLAVMGLLPGTASVRGSVELRGRELVGADEKSLRGVRGSEMSMIFQEPMTSLNPVLSVGRQIGEVLRRHQGLDRRQAKQRAVELLELVGIPAPGRRIHEYPHQLSGGMRQRVMIAIAVACDPAVLIADEPTTALDVTVQAGILDVLTSLRERLGTAIVLITHDLGVVAHTADRVLVMYAGRAVEHARADDLFAHPRHPYSRGLLDAVPRPGAWSADSADSADARDPADPAASTDSADSGPSPARRARLREIPGIVPGLFRQPDECTFAPRCSRADEQCTAERPVLGTPGETAGEQAGPGHTVACWHPLGDAGEPAGSRGKAAP